jgi:hypothetical protein
MPDPKHIAALIVAKHEGPVSDSEEGSETADEALKEAGQEVMSAMQAGDAEAFTEALKSFMQICYP